MTKLDEVKETKYSLLIRGSGGGYDQSEISREAASFWLGETGQELLNYIDTCQDDEDPGPNDKRYSFDFRHVADLASEFGFTEIEKLKVYLGDEDQAFGEQYLDESKVAQVELQNQDRIDNMKIATLTTWTTNWGHVVYKIKTVKPFEFDRMSFTKVVLNGVEVINQVFYDNVLLKPVEYFESLGEYHAQVVLK